MSFITRSNIFGDTSSTLLTNPPAFSTAETTAAGKLIDKMKWIADNQIDETIAATNWLGLASNAGQNTDFNGLVKKQYVPPTPLTSASVLAGWTAPAMPSLPAFPTLPSDLKIDMGTFKPAVNLLITELRTSWLAQAIPTVPTDLSRFDSFFRDVLNGVDETVINGKLAQLETDLKNALDTTKATALAALTSALTTMRTAVTAAETGLQPKLDAAIAVARDDTANIAWARARDQAAREATRLEAEAAEEIGARGFSMPNGALNAATAMARQATLDAASKAAGDQAVRSQEQYLEIAKISVAAWLQTSDFKMKSEIAALTSTAEHYLRYGAMELDSNRAKVKQAVDHLGMRIDFTKFAGDMAAKYRTDVANAMNGLINAYANLTGTEMQYHARIAEAQRQNLAALIDYYKAGLSYAEMGFKAAITNNEQQIQWAQVASQFIGTAVGHHVTAAQSTADAMARIAGMAMGGLNGVASVTSAG